LGGDVSRSGEGEYGSPLPNRDLRDDMGCGAEAIEAEFLSIAGDVQRPPADKPSAEQWRKRHVGAGFAQREGEARIGDCSGGKTTIARVSGEDRMVAQVFPVYAAIGTEAAGVAEPWDTDAFAHRQPFHAGSDRIDPADDFVARDDWRLRVCKFPIDHMQIRPADAARCHLDPNLPRPGVPIRQGCPFEGSPELFQHHCLHTYSLIFRGGTWMPLSFVLKAAKHAWQNVRQILGDETGPERDGGCAVKPNRGRRGQKRLHALGEQAHNKTAEDISRAGGGKGRGRVCIDNCPIIGRCDHRIGAFQNDDGAAATGGGARALELVAACVEHAFKLAFVWSDDAGVHNGPIKRLGIVLKGCDGISVD